MNGRIAKELQIEMAIQAKLKNMPEYVKSWDTNMKASRKSAATRRDYIYKIHAFLSSINPDILLVKLDDITDDVVANYFTSVQTKRNGNDVVYTSDSYQQTVWSCLNCFFEYLVKRKLMASNSMEMIARPKNRDLDRINEHRTLLSMDDFKRILVSVDDETNLTRRNRDRAILVLFMNTGMRKTALSSIMMDDVDFEKHLLTVVDKGNKRHQYVLTDEVCNAIGEWLNVRIEFGKGKGDDHLFLSDHGNAMSGTAMFDVVGKYTERALGKRISPHKLRSGYCSILYGATGDIEFVRRAVGHASSQTTQRYIVTNGEEKRRAADIMKHVLS